jgi:acyl-coenzyme A synthetase/AMP-(fatty) acid ligase
MMVPLSRPEGGCLVAVFIRPDRSAPPRLASYEAERARYGVEVPERYNPVLHIVEGWAGEAPDAVALVSLDAAGEVIATQTAAELAGESRKAARALLELGIRKGDRVLVMLPRHPAWYSALLGAMRIGAVPMPTPNQATARDIAYRLEASDAVTVITDEGGAGKLAEIDQRLPALDRAVRSIPEWEELLERAGDGETPDDPTAASDPLILFFTSGTVSYPKMALHAQSYPLGHVGTARFWHDLREGDLHWTISDTGWAKAAWGGLFGQWHERATVLQVALGRPDADTILGIVVRHGVTSFCAPPTLYRMLVQHDLRQYDLSALRHCTSAGEPLNPEVIRAWAEGTGGLTVYDGYGQTENVALVANYRAVPVRPGSMGKPVPGIDVLIVDDDGNDLPAGESGHIAVRTDPRPVGLFLGYFRNDAATVEAFRNGLYYTGDRGAKDEDGYFWFEARADDVITSAAYRIGPFEVESALLEHSAVAETAVVGKPDPERTEIVAAFIVLAAGYKGSPQLVEELQEHCKNVTAPYKYPREIHFVTELPKTISGKIRRSELRRRLREGEEL